MSTTSGLRSAPVATGTLDGIPLAHALVYIRNKRLSGVLELRASADRHAWLALWKGLVVSSMTTPTVARFGTVVYELGFIDAQTLDSTTLESASVKRPQMDLLIERGLITHAQRDGVLAEQARRRVLHLFTLPGSTTFSFREGNPSTTEPGVTVDLLAPIWRGLCDFPPEERAAEVLGRIGDHPLRLVSEAAMERAELTREEAALCEALARTPMTLAQLRKSSKLPRSRVDLLAYLLVITRCVEVEGTDRVPLPSGAMWAAAKAQQTSSAAIEAVDAQRGSTEVAAQSNSEAVGSKETPRAPAPRGPTEVGAEEIRRRALHLSLETPFATLGLAEGASAEAARAAFYRLGRLWHPDRVPAALEEVRTEIEAIFTHMTLAHRLLTDPAARPAVVARKMR